MKKLPSKLVCPDCGQKNEWSHGLTDADPAAAGPAEDDVVICARCQAVLKISGGTPAKITQEEFEELPPEVQGAIHYALADWKASLRRFYFGMS
jgi:hypothetical protein